MAKWHLDNIDVYGDIDPETITDFDVDIQLFLMCLIGEPIHGYVKMQGNDKDTFGVIFAAAGVSMFTFVDRKDVTWPK
jgi:hypothetical protein